MERGDDIPLTSASVSSLHDDGRGSKVSSAGNITPRRPKHKRSKRLEHNTYIKKMQT